MTKNKVKLIYDKKLDNNKELEEQTNYYDNLNIDNEFDISKAVFLKTQTKRINMIIPNSIFVEAEKISKKTGTGYQNTLKTAMAIGLHQLSKQL